MLWKYLFWGIHAYFKVPWQVTIYQWKCTDQWNIWDHKAYHISLVQGGKLFIGVWSGLYSWICNFHVLGKLNIILIHQLKQVQVNSGTYFWHICSDSQSPRQMTKWQLSADWLAMTSEGVKVQMSIWAWTWTVFQMRAEIVTCS